MKVFWCFKSAIYAFMRSFIKTIPFICIIAVIWDCYVCIKHKHITFLDILGIVICFAGGIVFSYLLYEDFFTKIFKSYKKTWEKILNTILYIGISCWIVLFIYGYINVINLYREDFLGLVIILIVLTVFSSLLYFLKNRFLIIYSTSSSLIVYRIILLVCITISSLLYTVLSVIIYFKDDSIDNCVSLSTALLSVWIVYLTFYHNFAYANYKRSQYVLFLRNFTMDEQICEAKLLEEIDNVCNKHRLFLMRIGNPRTVFDSSFGKTFYLQTVNWKTELQNHIKDAKLVFTVISNSDGLFWEIFNHVQYSSKFIYHILDISKMRDDLKDGRYDRIKQTKLGGILYFVCSCYNGPFAYNESGAFGVSFTFNNNYLIVGCNVSYIVEYMLKQKEVIGTEYLNVIKLEYGEDLKKIVICYNDSKFLINNTNNYY